MTDLPDSTIRRAQQGEEDACREIVAALHRPVIATIYRFLGPGHQKDAEDLAQEVFLKVFRALPQFDPSRARLSTWVYTFVRNHCFDVHKRRRVATQSLHGDGDEGQHDREFADRRELQPVADVENQELGRRIGEALARLGEDQRMVFVLREYEGLEYHEIALATGVSEGTVKSRLFRAKEALRQQLEPYLRTGT
jgi:RNA polymerase sigma-70 factor (ECF subfamily)